MKTAQEIILEIGELPLQEQQLIKFHLLSQQAEGFKKTSYSPEIMAEIEHDLAEARQGINVEIFDDMEDAIASLGLEEKE